jgi:hypothetical protein
MMPRGPKGEKRPADVIGAGIVVGRIALSKKFSGNSKLALKCRWCRKGLARHHRCT